MKKYLNIAAILAAGLLAACSPSTPAQEAAAASGQQAVSSPMPLSVASTAASSVPASLVEDRELVIFADGLAKDDSLVLDMWLFPPDVLTEAPVTVEDMKRGAYGGDISGHYRTADREKILPIFRFLMAQYRQSKIRAAHEGDEKLFSLSRAWLEFCSRQTGDCLVANISSGLQWRDARLEFQFQTRPYGSVAKIYGLGELESKSFRPLIQRVF
ncbi:MULTISPECIES: hypothetical protein [Eikenella]|uniref:Lipoprotein n=1 Tax=Eikenella longinqua TaxID=1795827 RepID=A0A1A9RXB9_9NEIS|nr:MULTISPECIES: hypothetical protein [Eikenella]OAM27872.1 hypothetical protein A7P95_06065 [Eikenella longinqua]